jgi:hypothetical protein
MSVDFDLEKKLEKGISFSGLFRSLFLYSTSLFCGFYWSDLVKETLLSWFPSGQGLIMKIGVGMLATFVIVAVAFVMLHGNKGSMHQDKHIKN